MKLALKLAIVAAEIKHQHLAFKANQHLAPEKHLSELDITKLVTNRKAASPDQATALARVLGHSVVELFPEENG